MIKKIFGIIPAVFMSMFVAGCTEEEEVAPLYFELTSEILECNSEQPVNVSVPIEGQTYKLSVKASPETEWSANLDGDDWVMVSPTTKQVGDGEISIVASPNSGNVQDRTATVSITSTANEKVYSYILTQLFDPNKLVQREESFVFIHYADESYNEDIEYATYLNKVDGDIKLFVLGQADVDAYNNDNATDYQLLSSGYYEPLPSSVTFGEDATLPFIITFKKEMSGLDASQEYVLPVCVSADGKERLKLWIVVKVSEQTLPMKEQEFTFYNAGEDMACKVSVERLEGEVTLTPFNEEKVASLGSDYKLIPAEYIDMPTSISFGDGEPANDVIVTFKKDIKDMALEAGKQYVYGFCINANGRPSSEVLVKADIVTPVLSMIYSDQQIDMSEEDVETTKSFGFTFNLNVENQWNFDVNLQTENLAEVVKQYNQENSTNYKLLPADNINFSGLGFISGTNEITVTATIDRSGLIAETQYLYPIIPIGCGGKPFEVEEKICYVKVYVAERIPGANELSEISLTSQMLTASIQNSGEEISNVLDNKDNTYWQSIWNSQTLPQYDPKYGIYIDIELDDKAPEKFLSLNYQTRNYENAVPSHIDIYAGENSNTLIKIGELRRNENTLPINKLSWIGNVENADLSKLPVFALKGVSAKYVRLAITSSYDNATNNRVDHKLDGTEEGNPKARPCVAIAELKLYGQ